MKSFIYPEMMVHVPLCTSKTPKNILIISNDANQLSNEIKKHDEMSSNIVPCSLDALRDLSDSSYDVVICEMSGDAAVIAHINRVLKEDGQLSITHDSLDEIQNNRILMQVLANYFKVIMPYNLGTGATAILASKEYHPTADIILQRSDMLDDLHYYNCDIHIASFAMPNYIRKEYLGIIKN
ncbi:MAG: spermidine synthase [Epsilonproteobacteria bacterium]|nr:spermidine synthase [Campylobacterota bacterium]OIO16881.1 MAG: spermidine synthase [Helicobacteraceae bacterium CG1_02_36_14]PIP09203.1 MAG: spermidine synthase [Sulfurimonas sp. CG23_combo_of_CG06-09_8_20_14_all_36_33]PIS24616.1 MAG: spermidine synthase [Sulfurimonas sp. CG08_land_8_20_14_0_20_36_33]PIU34965.1 MAG: spermidine synthase [Sulfurimonas sp. CG07_land_8_20_14_0_80_36_56]PIV02945.1 MAG: spermidine synthase [Sulfurimonas sp. CG03_land_8_20_14_0_80_36_25]PIV36709.1 MAG: spermidin